MEEIRRCRKCGARLLEHEKCCPVCGTRVMQSSSEFDFDAFFEQSDEEELHFESEQEKNYWKNKWIWITVAILVVVTTFMQRSLINDPIALADTTNKVANHDVSVSKITSTYSQATNINYLGISYVNDDSVYLVMNDELLKYDQDFNNRELVFDYGVSAFSEDDRGYYYLDSMNNYIFKDKKTKKEDVLLRRAYYVHKLDDQVFYQNDPDGETIHCLDLKSNEDKKINNEVSYNIIVDETSKRIFYTNKNKELVSIGLDGSDEKKIASDTSVYTYDGEHLYYINSDGLVKSDLDGKSDLIYKSSKLSAVNIIGDKLIVLDDLIIYTMDLTGENEKELYSMDVGGSIAFEVVGDKLVILTKGMMEQSVGYEIVGLDGKRKIIDSGEYPTIKGNEL